MKKVLTFLLASVVMLSVVGCGSKAPEGAVTDMEVPAFSITANDKTITQDDMKDYYMFKVTATYYNHSGKEFVADYVGYRASDVLKAAGFEGEYLTLTAYADDNYRIVVPAEIGNQEDTLIALYKDGEVFENGPWFAPCSSQTNGDYLGSLVELTADTELAPVIPDFSINVNGTEVSSKKLANYRILTKEALYYNHSGKEFDVFYKGFMLKDVLACAKVEGDFVSITTEASDGYKITVTKDVALQDDTLIAVYRDDEVCEGGPWFAPCSSQTNGDYNKDVVAIYLNVQ